MRNAEARIQAEIVAFIRTSAPDCIVFAVPNDGLYTKAEASKRRWMGVLAGIPDLILLAPVGRTFGLEIKTPGGVVSPEQRAMMFRMNALGVSVAMVRSLEDARNALRAWGVAFDEGAPPDSLPEAQACGAPTRRVFTATPSQPGHEMSAGCPARA